MKMLRMLKSLEIVTDAAFSRGRKQNDGFQHWGAYMRRSKITLVEFSFVASHCAQAFNSVRNGVMPAHAGKWQRDYVVTKGASCHKRTCGLRVFSKVYSVRGFLRALRAFHRDGIKLHLETPNVQIDGGAAVRASQSNAGLGGKTEDENDTKNREDMVRR